MTKLPIAGRVKTRLAREVGIVAATRFHRSTMRAVIQRLARQPFWVTYLAVTPDADRDSPMLPTGPHRLPQGTGDLGLRMQRPMRTLPPGPVCVIGSDIPAVAVCDIRRAFRLLGASDVVFGPAEDGGFWLVGMRRRPRVLDPYPGVAWSRPDTLERVERNLAGHAVARTTRHSDVDDGRDLARQAHASGRLVQPRRAFRSDVCALDSDSFCSSFVRRNPVAP